MKVELTTKDRILILGMLPERGDIFSVRSARELREALAFTDEELEARAFSYQWACKKCGRKLMLKRNHIPAFLENPVIKTEYPGEKPLDACCTAEMVRGSNVFWKTEGDNGKEFLFTEGQRKIVAEQFVTLSANKTLTEEHLPLYETFVEQK